MIVTHITSIRENCSSCGRYPGPFKKIQAPPPHVLQTEDEKPLAIHGQESADDATKHLPITSRPAAHVRVELRPPPPSITFVSSD